MNELDRLYDELKTVQSMSEDAVCMLYNVDFKQEYINLLNEEIDKLEDALSEVFEQDDDREIERERTALCLSQGISRFC